MTRSLIHLAVASAFTVPILADGPSARKAEGYQGVWFELGQKSAHGDKYSGGLGTYTTSHVPPAVYTPRVNRPRGQAAVSELKPDPGPCSGDLACRPV